MNETLLCNRAYVTDRLSSDWFSHNKIFRQAPIFPNKIKRVTKGKLYEILYSHFFVLLSNSKQKKIKLGCETAWNLNFILQTKRKWLIKLSLTLTNRCSMKICTETWQHCIFLYYIRECNGISPAFLLVCTFRRKLDHTLYNQSVSGDCIRIKQIIRPQASDNHHASSCVRPHRWGSAPLDMEINFLKFIEPFNFVTLLAYTVH